MKQGQQPDMKKALKETQKELLSEIQSMMDSFTERVIAIIQASQRDHEKRITKLEKQ